MQRWLFLVLVLVGALVFAVIMARSRAAREAAEPAREVRADEGSAHVAAGARVPVVVELFTSEGCSSCPPADELLRRLEQTQPVAGAEVIALEQHVDYWNRLGWADPFSAPQFSARQSAYADRFGSAQVYTPQMIVDGQAEFPGGNQTRARAAVAAAAGQPKATISLTRAGQPSPDGLPLAVRVERLPNLNPDETAEVLLAVTETDLRTEVAAGENAGRTLAHAAVVRELSPLGQLDARGGEPFAARPVLALGARWQVRNLRAVVFVQERTSRRILGAAALKLAE
ncbi:MAG TPA: DUF1223 domain-containing protein [Pyrinomonadaceae bacterium]|jgi:hypothetical protein